MGQVYAMFFSPTGTTKKVVTKIADYISWAWGGADAVQIDFTLPGNRIDPVSFHEHDLVVFGVPVYAGRVPNVLLSYIRTVEGSGALAVPVVCYGNRAYDDALVELRDLLEADGFHTVAAGAFIGEHSFSTTLAAGRPDRADLDAAARFARHVLEKLEKPVDGLPPVSVAGQVPYRPYYVPKNRAGEPVNILKDKPAVSNSCVRCGLCSRVCPMGSIDPINIRVYVDICIKCGACVKKCPVGARYYDSHNYNYHKEELELGFTRRAEPEMFL